MMNNHINRLMDPDSTGVGRKGRIAELKRLFLWHINKPAIVMGTIGYYKYLEKYGLWFQF